MKLFAKIIILVVVFLAGLLVGISVMQKPAVAPTISDKLAAGITVALILDYGNGEVQNYRDIEMQLGQTVFDLLKKVTAENVIEFSYQDYGAGLGALIESINNVKNDPVKNTFWHYFVNDVFAEVGASNYPLADGDVVAWKYAEAQY